MRYQGQITIWKDDKGYGFITPNDGGPPVFVHIKSFSTRRFRPERGKIVVYDLGTNDKGQTRAENVIFADEPVFTIRPSASSIFPAVLAIAFIVAIAGIVAADKLPIIILGLYLLASVVAFTVYWSDKSAALVGE